MIKLHDSELKIMNILWSKGATTAKNIAEIMEKQVGWKKTTTYTLIQRCISKGAIARKDPDFICVALLAKEQSQILATEELLNKLFDGSADQLVASILGRKRLSSEEILNLKRVVKDLE